MFSVNSVPVPGPLSISQAQPKRPRLNRAGAAILEDFRNTNPNGNEPSQVQMQVLLEQIRTIPGCAEYDLRGIKAWFKRKRSPSSKHNESNRLADSLYSTLTPSSIAILTTLQKACPNPTSDVVLAWAQLLSVSPGDIITWLGERRAHRMPTPSDSTSPSPIISPLEQEYYPEEYYTKMDSRQSPLFSTPPYQHSVPFYAHSHRGHAQTHTLPGQMLVHDAESPSSASAKASVFANLAIAPYLNAIVEPETPTDGPRTGGTPKTAQEFEAFFAPFMEKIERILQDPSSYKIFS